MNILPRNGNGDNDVPPGFYEKMHLELLDFLRTTIGRLNGAIKWMQQTQRTHISVHLMKARHQIEQALALLDKGGEK